MNTEDLGNSRFLNLLFKPAGMMMESRLRHWLMNPVTTLRCAGIKPGQRLLEVGCGTGFFTMPAAKLIGMQGHLIAMDALADYAERVSEKVKTAGLRNVTVVKRDALDTGLETESIDKILLFGVLPYPALPLKQLLPEMHRILRINGTIAVWLFPPYVHFWVPRSILKSGLFAYQSKRYSVYNYLRI